MVVMLVALYLYLYLNLMEGQQDGGAVSCNVGLHRWTTIGSTTPRWVRNLIHAKVWNVFDS